jgi:hypothetical protein
MYLKKITLRSFPYGGKGKKEESRSCNRGQPLLLVQDILDSYNGYMPIYVFYMSQSIPLASPPSPPLPPTTRYHLCSQETHYGGTRMKASYAAPPHDHPTEAFQVLQCKCHGHQIEDVM